MRGYSNITIGIVGSFVFCASAAAAAAPSPNEYQGIVDRNAFALHPPPVAEKEPPVVPPLPKIILNGVTSILFPEKFVLMKVQRPGRGAQLQEESLMLAEGQRAGDIEVLEINEHNGSVRLVNSGTVQTLYLDRDGPAPR